MTKSLPDVASCDKIKICITYENIYFTSNTNRKRYDSELPYQRPGLIEVMEIEIDLTT